MEVLVDLILIWLFVPSRQEEPDRQEELYRERDRYINRRTTDRR